MLEQKSIEELFDQDIIRRGVKEVIHKFFRTENFYSDYCKSRKP